MTVRVVLTLFVLALAACGSEEATKSNSEATHGSLALALTGTDPHGHQYRLRDAEFSISGCSDYSDGSGGAGGSNSSCISTSLSSEDNPDAATIVKRLVPGYYNISLSNGWRLEELTASGPVPVEKVVLLSPQYTYAYVWEGGQAFVAYQFGVNGDLIDFRHGDLAIGIEVEQPGDRDCYYPYSDSDAGVVCPVGGSGGSAGGGFPFPAGQGAAGGGAGVGVFAAGSGS